MDYLQQLCSNDVNIPVGGIVHTGMQNEHGGYENDCMIVRQNDNSYVQQINFNILVYLYFIVKIGIISVLY
mgnify:CR=1 FL=1